ncbi:MULTISPECIES: ATP-binding cassette domain-containing protein [unclassified Mesorhizobium]|uniref:ATP-binding cassette domain-containing protein n=1 Tax=unclassified Mesorhizobium TaxID=325217 RepID=UPI00333CC5F6
MKSDKGETLALVGESGSGKSTIARTMVGLQRAASASGSVSFGGQEIEELSGAERKPSWRRMRWCSKDPVGSLSPRLMVGSLLTEPFRTID